MFGFVAQARILDKSRNVERAAARGNYRNLFHAAASLRKAAARSVEKAPKGEASAPGEPPHTHRGAFLRRALRYFVDKQKQEALIGFQASKVEDVGAVHEFGEERGGVDFPERPTMLPALAENAARIGDQWRGSIGV